MGLPIGAVERETGISKDLLRMWERRYGFPEPARDEQGDREQERAHRRMRRDRLRSGQGDRAAHARPDDDTALARAQRFALEVVQVGSAHRVAARAPLEAATIVVKRVLPVLGAQLDLRLGRQCMGDLDRPVVKV